MPSNQLRAHQVHLQPDVPAGHFLLYFIECETGILMATDGAQRATGDAPRHQVVASLRHAEALADATLTAHPLLSAVIVDAEGATVIERHSPMQAQALVHTRLSRARQYADDRTPWSLVNRLLARLFGR